MTKQKYLLSGATLSPDKKYRWSLTRIWDGELPRIVFIGLNPSTADATKDDPTIRRCVAFARGWGFGELVMVNLFALRSTDPKALADSLDPVGEENNDRIMGYCRDAGKVIAAWGSFGFGRTRAGLVLRMLRSERIVVECLGLTKNGFPRHPLYVRGDAVLMPIR